MEDFGFLKPLPDSPYERHKTFITDMLTTSLVAKPILLFSTVEIDPDKERWVPSRDLPVYVRDEHALMVYSLLITLIKKNLYDFRLSDFIHFKLPTKCIVEIHFIKGTDLDNLSCKRNRERVERIEIICPIGHERNRLLVDDVLLRRCRQFHEKQLREVNDEKFCGHIYRKSEIEKFSEKAIGNYSIEFPPYLKDEAKKLANELEWPMLENDIWLSLKNFWLGTYVIQNDCIFSHIPAMGYETQQGIELTSGGVTIAADRPFDLDYNEVRNKINAFFRNSLIPRAVRRTLYQLSIHLTSKDFGKVEKHPKSEIIIESEIMKDILHTVEKVAPSDATVLVLGESGVGKELIARRIHTESPRKHKQFVSISCAAIPETLLESELFGYKKGAFTGANSDKDGLFKVADKSSLFLDEIGDASLLIQMKLLRALEEKEIQPLGAIKTLKVDVRLIAATNKDLEEEIKKGTFREDLYYRLNVISLRIPPLRERREDIMPIAEYYLNKFANKTGKRIRGFNSDVVEIFENYEWPGNIRVLANVVEHAVIMCEGNLITEDCLPKEMQHKVRKKKAKIELPERIARLLAPICENLKVNKSKLERLIADRNQQALKRYFVSQSTSKTRCLEADYLRKKSPIIQDIAFHIKEGTIKIPRNLTPRTFETLKLRNQQTIAEKDANRKLLWHCDAMLQASKEELYEACCSQLLADIIKYIDKIQANSLIDTCSFMYRIENDVVTANGNIALQDMLGEQQLKNNQFFTIYLWFLYFLNVYVELFHKEPTQ